MSWWFEPAPALRLAALRVLIVGFGLAWLIGLTPLMIQTMQFPAERFSAVGVVTLLDAPLGLAAGIGIQALTIAAGVAALLGWRFRASAIIYGLGLLWITSYRNSWGMIFHSENLLVIHTLILMLLPAADTWSLDARRSPSRPTPDSRYGWGPKLMVGVTVIAYVLAGVAKLRNAGWAWLDGDVLLAHVAWDNLRKLELGAPYSPLGAWLSGYPAIFAPLAWMSLLLELGAVFALLGGRIAAIWALGMWSFHLGVAAIMAIVFPYPLMGVAFAPLFAVERPLLRLAAWLRSRRLGPWLEPMLPSEE